MRADFDLVVCGLGGQGILTCANAVAHAAALEGSDVLATELVGLGQRGGSVTAHVRVAERVVSPRIPAGQADVMLALDRFEAARNAHSVSPEGLMLVMSYELTPNSVALGLSDESEPDAGLAIDTLRAAGMRIIELPYTPEVGRMNVYALGALSVALPFNEGCWSAVLGNLPHSQGGAESPLSAFESGRADAVARIDD